MQDAFASGQPTIGGVSQRASLISAPKSNSGSGLPRRGGVRTGAGRRPKAVKYAQQVARAEKKIVAALPELLDLLLTAARGGDASAAKYLVDRVLGRVQTQGKPLAEDYGLPSTHPGAEEISAMQRRRELGKALARPAAIRDEISAAEQLTIEAELTAGRHFATGEEFTQSKIAFPDSDGQDAASVELESRTG